MDILLKILGYISIQIKNFKYLINNQNFDDVHDLESVLIKQENMNLSETCDDPSKLSMLNGLKADDQASVIFGKIALYTEIVFKSHNQARSLLINNVNFPPIVKDLFKIQSLINRYHAKKYEKDIRKDMARLLVLLPKHKELIDQTDFSKFNIVREPATDEEEALNLFYKYEHDKLQSLLEFH